MSAGKLNIKIEIGATWGPILVTYRDGNDDRIDLTGYTARMHILDREGGTPLIGLSTTNGRIRLQEDEDEDGETQGVITLEIPDDTTDDITNTTGVYDLKLYSGDGREYRLLRGSVTFIPARTLDEEV